MCIDLICSFAPNKRFVKIQATSVFIVSSMLELRTRINDGITPVSMTWGIAIIRFSYLVCRALLRMVIHLAGAWSVMMFLQYSRRYLPPVSTISSGLCELSRQTLLFSLICLELYLHDYHINPYCSSLLILFPNSLAFFIYYSCVISPRFIKLTDFWQPSLSYLASA